ncbi:Os10g0529600, partial [Oryza sativa Japonica Group]
MAPVAARTRAHTSRQRFDHHHHGSAEIHTNSEDSIIITMAVQRFTQIQKSSNLVVDVCGPEASNGAFIWVGGEDGVAGAGEDLVDVLHDDLRLADGVPVVDEHGHRLVHRVGGEQEVALVAEILLDVLVAHALEVERELHSGDVGARPVAEQLQLVVSGHLSCAPMDTMCRCVCLALMGSSWSEREEKCVCSFQCSAWCSV